MKINKRRGRAVNDLCCGEEVGDGLSVRAREGYRKNRIKLSVTPAKVEEEG